MSTTTYYISYEQPRRPPWRLILLILLAIVALGLLAGIAYGIYALASADSPPERELEPLPLREVLMSIHRTDDAATFFLPDISKSVARGADVDLQGELLSVLTAAPDAPGYSPNPIAVASLAQVKKNPSDASQFYTLDDPVKQAHLAQSVAVPPADRPSFIYDSIATAYHTLGEAKVQKGNRAIVVLTDGIDGGYLVVDPLELTRCPSYIPNVGTDEVCSPLTITIPIDLAALTKCPPELLIAGGEMACMPVGDTTDYYPIDPADVMPCPDGAPDDLCAETVVDYEPINPRDVVSCPPELEDIPPGQACVDLRSELQLEDLLAMLATGNPPVTVHTIGLGGSPDNHENLQLIAKATGGDYYHCTRRGCLRPD